MRAPSSQRVLFRNSRGLNLVGQLRSAGSDAVIVMAHGFMSDKSSRGRFDRLARRLNEAGFDSLAFDFGGCGESDDDSLTLAKEIDDLRAAVGFLRQRGYRGLALWGHSLGGRVCLEARIPDLATMVLTGAATGPMQYRWTEHFSPAQLQELAAKGRLAVPLEEGPRRAAIIEPQTLDDFASGDQAATLGRVRCPVLLVHGDGDAEERALLALSRQALGRLPKGSRLEVIEGAEHGFLEPVDRFDRVIELGLGWLGRYFGASSA